MNSHSTGDHYASDSKQPSLTEHHAEMQNLQELTSMGWYHGEIPRIKAETLVRHNGDFLVRDSSSQPGDLVLTTWWQNSPLHFVVNKQLKLNKKGNLSVLYLFEEDSFDSVTALIHYYMDNRKLISKHSGARISFPITRNIPIDGYNIRKKTGKGHTNTVSHSGSHSANSTPSQSPKSAPRNRHSRTASQPLLSLSNVKSSVYDKQLSTRQGSIPAVGDSPAKMSIPQKTLDIEVESNLKHRTGSEPDLSPFLKKCNRETLFPPLSNTTNNRTLTGSDGELSKHPPPKPSRSPSMKKASYIKPKIAIRRLDLYEDDGKDYTDYDQVKSWSQLLVEKNEIKYKTKDSSCELIGEENTQEKDKNNETNETNHKVIMQTNISHTTSDKDRAPHRYEFLPPYGHIFKSFFDLGIFSSNILTPENKPLESSALYSSKMLIFSENAEVIAQHITWLDVHLLGLVEKPDSSLRIHSGNALSIFTLPQGHHIRNDLIERSICLQMFVETLVLTCSDEDERAKMIVQWIEVAQALYSFVGNMLSYSAVMSALNSPEVTRLKHSWKAVEKQCSVSLWTFRTKLCEASKSLQCANSLLPLQNVSVPHVLPIVQLLERNEADIYKLLPCESYGGDSFDMILAHLEMARLIVENTRLYQSTICHMFAYFKPVPDILEVLMTETHLRLLWGKKGSNVQKLERYAKFEQVLSALSEKIESTGSHP